ncbi:hypothetical protein [Streptomyces sp. NPDC056169]|uniref:hypothetical protein n=1 Tax=Streptomyces sp. NPDC056169 TaxID=3345734 RepID=UPI0035DCC584
MISEPELDGEDGFVTSEVLTETPPPGPHRPPRTRRPWLWALGGAVLASAVWGGGLYAYERGKEPGPDLGGYKPVEDLCEVAELKALVAALGKRSQDGAGDVVNQPAISESSCMVTFGPVDTGQSIDITYTLHKVVDPGPEFAVRAEQYGVIQALDGVGEQAFFDDRNGEGAVLRILDGQAEISFDMYRQHYEVDGKPDQTEPIDLSGIEIPMTQDALALMAALKK